MWGQKFGYVVGSALSFPLHHFSKLKGLYLYTLLVLGGLFAIVAIVGGGTIFSMQMDMDRGEMGNLPFGFIIALFFAIIFGTLAILPYIVGIIRSAATGEQSDSRVVGAMFEGRQLRFIWAYIKVVFALSGLVLLGMLVSFLLVLLFGGLSGNQAGAGIGGFLSMVFMVVAIAVLAVRLYFAPVLAALDKGTSLKDSWELTRGSWWLIFLSVLVVGIVVAIAQWIVIFLGAMIIAPLAFILGPVMLPVGVVLYIAVVLFTMIPQSAALGFLYLVLTDQVNFAQPVVEDKSAKA